MPTDSEIITKSMFKSPRLVVLGLSLFTVLIFIASMGLFPQKPPFITIKANSEFLKYKVVRPEIAAIPLEDAKIRIKAGQCPDLLTGNAGPLLIKPSKGTIIGYHMRNAQIAISLTHSSLSVGTVELSDGKICKLDQRASFVFSKPKSDSPSARPLPIAGPAEMGAELGSPLLPRPNRPRTFNTMLGGELQIFGRTSLPPNRGALYPAEDATFPLPAGGRLSSGGGIEKDNIQEDDAWYGVAIIGENAFEVSASTETANLQFYRPGKSGDAEQFAVSLLARLFKDPSVAIYSLALVIFGFVAELLAIFWDLPLRTQIARHLVKTANPNRSDDTSDCDTETRSTTNKDELKAEAMNDSNQ